MESVDTLNSDLNVSVDDSQHRTYLELKTMQMSPAQSRWQYNEVVWLAFLIQLGIRRVHSSLVDRRLAKS